MNPGTQIGGYEVVALIGAGGMGEVYRARDTKLDRDVAIKILPAAFAADAGRLARFEREAKLLASLNHSNIAHIFGVEDRALVMELVEGESPKGPMPFEEAWKLALQIADAFGICEYPGGPDQVLVGWRVALSRAGKFFVITSRGSGMGSISTSPIYWAIQ